MVPGDIVKIAEMPLLGTGKTDYASAAASPWRRWAWMRRLERHPQTGDRSIPEGERRQSRRPVTSQIDPKPTLVVHGANGRFAPHLGH